MRVLLALFLISLSGCADVLIEPPQSTENNQSAESENAPPEAPNAPETPDRPQEASQPARPVAGVEPHGEVREQWGNIGTKLDGTQWVAERTVKLSNGVGNADLIELGLDLRYADVTITDDEVGGYTYDFVLYVRADTQQGAEEGMRNVDLRHSDTLSAGTLSLNTAPAITNLVAIVGSQPTLSYTLDISVPWHIAHDFDIEAAYTELEVGTFFGPAASVDARYTEMLTDTLEMAEVNVALEYGAWQGNVVDAQGLDVAARYSDVELLEAYLWDLAIESDYSYLGVGDLRLHGDAAIDASYSELRLDVLDTGGYDVYVDMRYSEAMADLPDLDVIENSDDLLHVRTIGFTGKSLQADIDAELAYSDFRIG